MKATTLKSKIIVLAGVAIMALFASCTKNEDLIIGTWQCIRAEGNVNGMTEDVGAKYEFKADGKVRVLLVGQKIEYKYSVKDNELTIGEGKTASVSSIDILTKKGMKLSRTAKNKAAVVDYERI